MLRLEQLSRTFAVGDQLVRALDGVEANLVSHAFRSFWWRPWGRST